MPDHGRPLPRLMFVYNADSGLLSGAGDYLRKAFSPRTYPCRLCAITFGGLGMRSQWKEFVDSLPFQVEFLHRDELAERYPKEMGPFPAAYLEEDRLRQVISAQEIEGCLDLPCLLELVRRKLGVPQG